MNAAPLSCPGERSGSKIKPRNMEIVRDDQLICVNSQLTLLSGGLARRPRIGGAGRGGGDDSGSREGQGERRRRLLEGNLDLPPISTPPR